MPEPDLGKSALRIRDDPQVHLFIGIDSGHPELCSVERYLSVHVGSSGISETEDVEG